MPDYRKIAVAILTLAATGCWCTGEQAKQCVEKGSDCTDRGYLLLQWKHYIPIGFDCKNTKNTKSPRYSTPPSENDIKVDLIHIFCGEVQGGKASGFHAVPNGVSPPTVKFSNPTKKINESDYAEFKDIEIYSGTRWVKKKHPSTLWPTIMSMNDVMGHVTMMVHKCRYMNLLR